MLDTVFIRRIIFQERSYPFALPPSPTNHKLELIFQMNSIPQDGDDYKIEIDYDGCTPGGHGAETLIAQYRWGTSGGWTTIDTFFYPKHNVYDITDPTSTTIQIIFYDQNRWWWDSKHTWDFGFEPILIVYWD